MESGVEPNLKHHYSLISETLWRKMKNCGKQIGLFRKKVFGKLNMLSRAPEPYLRKVLGGTLLDRIQVFFLRQQRIKKYSDKVEVWCKWSGWSDQEPRTLLSSIFSTSLWFYGLRWPFLFFLIMLVFLSVERGRGQWKPAPYFWVHKPEVLHIHVCSQFIGRNLDPWTHLASGMARTCM